MMRRSILFFMLSMYLFFLYYYGWNVILLFSSAKHLNSLKIGLFSVCKIQFLWVLGWHMAWTFLITLLWSTFLYFKSPSAYIMTIKTHQKWADVNQQETNKVSVFRLFTSNEYEVLRAVLCWLYLQLNPLRQTLPSHSTIITFFSKYVTSFMAFTAISKTQCTWSISIIPDSKKKTFMKYIRIIQCTIRPFLNDLDKALLVSCTYAVLMTFLHHISVCFRETAVFLEQPQGKKYITIFQALRMHGITECKFWMLHDRCSQHHKLALSTQQH